MGLHLLERLQGRYIRTAARTFFRRPFSVQTQVPIVSFTFDDFPRSALLTGGAILQRYGAVGTYYASFGLMGTEAPTGQIFLREDLDVLLKQGHELGCHTYDHYDSWETESRQFENSVLKNREALEEFCPGVSFQTFSYPISPPRARTKRRVSRHFVCSRGGGQTFNTGATDLNYLASYFLEKSRGEVQPVKDLIDRNREARGWLILDTHDVSETPTPFGCTPSFFEEVVQHAVNSGGRVLPVLGAWAQIRGSSAS
jgi:peptidoglycan/xylan/chitin deacetylase (PgdA/CDA1 family)